MIVLIRMSEEEIVQACTEWLERQGAIITSGATLEEPSAAGWISSSHQVSFSARCEVTLALHPPVR